MKSVTQIEQRHQTDAAANSKAVNLFKYLSKVRRSLERHPLEYDKDWQAPFALVRRLQGIAEMLKIIIAPEMLREFFEEVAPDFSDSSPDDFVEAAFDAWEKVRFPEGQNPLEYAFSETENEIDLLPGEWPTPSVLTQN